MARVSMGIAAAVGAVVGVALLALLAWNLADRGPAIAEPAAEADGLDLSRLLVLADADMAATAYADGRLHPIEGAVDALIALDVEDGRVVPGEPRVAASNTVMGWPGAMTADPGGRFAYVVEGRGPIDRAVSEVESVFAEMPDGQLLTTVDLASGAVADTRPVCRRPNGIDLAPDGGWLLVACGEDAGEMTVVPLVDGRPGEPRRFDLDLAPIAERPDIDGGLSYAMIHPGGAAAGYVQSNLGVGLVRFVLDADGVPEAAAAEPPAFGGDWLTVGRWTRAGGHFVVADVEWGPSPAGAVFLGAGEVLSFALSPEDDTRGIVSAATVSKSPEAIELNRAGDRLVAVNMERTYLPGDGPLRLVPGRGASSLSLVSVDDATGALRTLGEPLGFRGVLPEDAVFDADGDRLVVVVYQDHDAPRSEGWVEIFAVADDRIRPTGERIAMPRGAHDLFAID